MKFYNKYYKNCYEELLTYYPDFYRNVYEMTEILKVFGKLSDKLENGIEHVFENGFIDTADEKTIAAYERIIGLSASEKKSLAERRGLVKSHLVGTGKISASLINEMIRAYTGTQTVCSFDQRLDGDTNKGIVLDIDVSRGSKNYINFDDINKLLSVKLPAHIMYRLAVVYEKKLGISCNFEAKELKPAVKSIAVSYNLKIGGTNYPRCGAYYCGLKNMF